MINGSFLGTSSCNCSKQYTSVNIWNKTWHLGASQDGVKPIQVAAARGFVGAVEILFPLTSKVDTIPTWTVSGILEHMQSETNKQQVLIS